MKKKTFFIFFIYCIGLFYYQSAVAAQAAVPVSATITSKNVCRFDTTAATLAFGAINPSSTSNATATTTMTIRCIGSSSLATFVISDNNGLYSSGGVNRMQNTTLTSEYLPYLLTYTPVSTTIPKNTSQTITINGTVLVRDFQNAYIGNYRDTVTLTISP